MKQLITLAAAVAGIALGSSWAMAQPENRGRSPAPVEARPEVEPRGPGAAAEARMKAEEAAAEGRARTTGAATASEGSEEAGSPGDSEGSPGRGAAGPGASQEQARGPAAAREGQSQGQAQREAAQGRPVGQMENVHARRMAQLERLRALAVENDRQEMSSRVDLLMEREMERHRRQMDRLEDRETGASSSLPSGAGAPRE